MEDGLCSFYLTVIVAMILGVRLDPFTNMVYSVYTTIKLAHVIKLHSP